MDVETSTRNAVHVIQERLQVAFELIDVYCETQAEIHYTKDLQKSIDSIDPGVLIKQEDDEIYTDLASRRASTNEDEESLEMVLQEKCVINGNKSNEKKNKVFRQNGNEEEKENCRPNSESSEHSILELEEELAVLHELLESAILLLHGENKPRMSLSDQFNLENQFFDIKNSLNIRNLELIKLQNALDCKAKEIELETDILNKINDLKTALQEIEETKLDSPRDDAGNSACNESAIKLLNLLE